MHFTNRQANVNKMLRGRIAFMPHLCRYMILLN